MRFASPKNRTDIYFSVYLAGTIHSLNNPKMLNQKIASLLIDRIDFQNDAFEVLVEDALVKGMAVSAAASQFEAVIADEFPEDPDAQAKQLAIAEGVIDLASEIGSAFPSLTPDQRARFKNLFQTVFESESEAVEAAGETIFNESVEALGAIQALNEFVPDPE